MMFFFHDVKLLRFKTSLKKSYENDVVDYF